MQLLQEMNKLEDKSIATPKQSKRGVQLFKLNCVRYRKIMKKN